MFQTQFEANLLLPPQLGYFLDFKCFEESKVKYLLSKLMVLMKQIF